MGDTAVATMTVKAKQRKGIKRPVLHILMADGRVTEFKTAPPVVVVDTGIGAKEAGDRPVYALLFSPTPTADGNIVIEPFVTPEGDLAIVKVPPLRLAVIENSGAPLTYKQVAQRLGVSPSTVKRLVKDGKLAAPAKVDGMKRKVLFTLADVDQYVLASAKDAEKR